MIFQQFGGVNAIAFYANSIFISAGNDPTFGLSSFAGPFQNLFCALIY